jgi:hypothetical protein
MNCMVHANLTRQNHPYHMFSVKVVLYIWLGMSGFMLVPVKSSATVSIMDDKKVAVFPPKIVNLWIL